MNKNDYLNKKRCIIDSLMWMLCKSNCIKLKKQVFLLKQTGKKIGIWEVGLDREKKNEDKYKEIKKQMKNKISSRALLVGFYSMMLDLV